MNAPLNITNIIVDKQGNFERDLLTSTHKFIIDAMQDQLFAMEDYDLFIERFYKGSLDPASQFNRVASITHNHDGMYSCVINNIFYSKSVYINNFAVRHRIFSATGNITASVSKTRNSLFSSNKFTRDLAETRNSRIILSINEVENPCIANTISRDLARLIYFTTSLKMLPVIPITYIPPPDCGVFYAFSDVYPKEPRYLLLADDGSYESEFTGDESLRHPVTPEHIYSFVKQLALNTLSEEKMEQYRPHLKKMKDQLDQLNEIMAELIHKKQFPYITRDPVLMKEREKKLIEILMKHELLPERTGGFFLNFCDSRRVKELPLFKIFPNDISSYAKLVTHYYPSVAEHAL